nr:uncharacterized protein LOC109167603 [Ipomoea trifida]
MAEGAEEMGGESEDSNFCNPRQGVLYAQEITLSAVLTRLISAVLFPGPDTPGTFQHRVKAALSEYAPLLCEASQNTARNICAWSHRGSPFRALLLLSVSVLEKKFTSLFSFLEKVSNRVTELDGEKRSKRRGKQFLLFH